jgi:hypothetical protein
VLLVELTEVGLRVAVTPAGRAGELLTLRFAVEL